MCDVKTFSMMRTPKHHRNSTEDPRNWRKKHQKEGRKRKKKEREILEVRARGSSVGVSRLGYWVRVLRWGGSWAGPGLGLSVLCRGSGAGAPGRVEGEGGRGGRGERCLGEERGQSRFGQSRSRSK